MNSDNFVSEDQLTALLDMANTAVAGANATVAEASKSMVGDELTVAEALMVALSGILVVFFVLGALSVLITVIAKVVGSIEAKMPATPVPAPKAAPVVVASSPAEDEELIAVLMAAIAEETQCDIGSFQITSVTEKT